MACRQWKLKLKLPGSLRARAAQMVEVRRVGLYAFHRLADDEAVSLLKRHGFNVRRLEVGFPDWRANGLPVVTADQMLTADRLVTF